MLVRGSGVGGGADVAGGGADAVASAAINNVGGRAIITKASEEGFVARETF